MMKNICVLGSTGSIGINTLDVIRQHPEQFNAGILVVNKNIGRLIEQVKEFKPPHVVIYDRQAYQAYKTLDTDSGRGIWCGFDGLKSAISEHAPDLIVNALVGFAGLEPTIFALNAGIDVALANKETLVVAGELVTGLSESKNTKIIPIDSEHSAIWQCLAGETGNSIRRLILTASGGPFRTWPKEALADVTPEQALKHPNWQMGAKITIDSATMMNKGLEVIEAFWLYHVPLEAIEVVIHPQSIIHSMVEFEDGSIKAQLGVPDMRIPIQYALTHPLRASLQVAKTDFSALQSLTFEQPDLQKFPCLQLAYAALKKGKSYPTVLNAANEVAVEAFLNRRIPFNYIARVIEEALDGHAAVSIQSFEDLFDVDRQVRRTVQQSVAHI